LKKLQLSLYLPLELFIAGYIIYIKLSIIIQQ